MPERNVARRYGSARFNARLPSVRERIKDEIQYDLESPKRKKLIAKADAVYNRLTNPMREPAPRE
jgi:hypothetical protein